MRKYINILYKAGYQCIMHDGVEHAGYMSFMNILSLFPFLVFIVALAGFIGETNFGISFIKILMENLPGDFIDALKPRINEIISGPPHGLLTLSILGAIWTSSSSVEGLRTILNRVYQVQTPPAYIFRRLLSISQFLALTAIIIFTMFLLVFVPIIYQKIEHIFLLHSPELLKSISFDFFKPVWVYTRNLVLVATLFFTVSTLYYILPNVKLTFKSVIPGSAIVVFLWIMTGSLLASFLGSYQQVSIIYGSLGGIIISMLFFYIINMIFIYGAELNYLLSKSYSR